MKNDLISVIVPVYNAETFLHRCVDSILAQIYKNLEIILVNDGSSDKSSTICDEYAAKDSRIKVVHKPNGGVSSARNAGIDVAQGEFLAFVDCDDEIESVMYEHLHQRITTSNADVCICGITRYYEGAIRFIRIPEPDDQCLSLKQYYEGILQDPDIFYELFTYPVNKLYKRCLLSGKGNALYSPVRFPEDRKLAEDLCFNIDYFSCISNGIVFEGFTPYKYYETGNISSLTKTAALEDRFTGLSYLQEAMMKMLPDKTEQIKEIMEYKKSISIIKNIHVAIIYNKPIPCKLKWHMVASVLRHSSITINKLSALLLFFLPRVLYKVLFRIYSSTTPASVEAPPS